MDKEPQILLWAAAAIAFFLAVLAANVAPTWRMFQGDPRKPNKRDRLKMKSQAMKSNRPSADG